MSFASDVFFPVHVPLPHSRRLLFFGSILRFLTRDWVHSDVPQRKLLHFSLRSVRPAFFPTLYLPPVQHFPSDPVIPLSGPPQPVFLFLLFFFPGPSGAFYPDFCLVGYTPFSFPVFLFFFHQNINLPSFPETCFFSPSPATVSLPFW